MSETFYKRVPCGHCEAPKMGCLACHHTGYVYEPVDPKYTIAPSTILKALDYMESGLSDEGDGIDQILINDAAWRLLLQLKLEEDPTGKFAVIMRAARKKARSELLPSSAHVEAGRATGEGGGRRKQMSDQDWITKKQAHEAICGMAVEQGQKNKEISNCYTLPDIFQAIDALTPEPVCQDAVSREEVGKIVTALYNDSHFLGLSVPAAVAVLLGKIFKLPSLPGPRAEFSRNGVRGEGRAGRSEAPDYEAMYEELARGIEKADKAGEHWRDELTPIVNKHTDLIEQWLEARHTPVEDSERSRTASAKPSGEK